ncbi:Hydrolase-4 domain-containing protein [Mycena sanguinolenta]|uniref:Hydrolase-4 domain-containing protein n=1 Tax=Mycena sanguinolenta TaxID=230812 RepID=A0A8H6Z279_9AGAR|nr:Hydrolase-4 domain-containing protein [Mycena sanguinolenta]
MLSTFLRHGQKVLVYPSAFEKRPREVALPSDLGLEYSDLTLVTSDKAVLHCYLVLQAQQSPVRIRENANRDFHNIDTGFIPPTSYDSPAVATLILFHGNGMNYGDLVYAAKRFIMRRCNVLMLSYRGYGDSEGVPSERGLRLDAQAALDHVKSDPELSTTPTILFGTSLGGAVAIDLASRNPSSISALIVENTFTSLPGVVRDWPGIGIFSFLCFQKWNSASKIPLIPTTMPILMLSGTQDEVVPKKHMETLWEIARKRGDGTADRDTFETFADGKHSDTFICPRYWSTVGEFLTKVTA